MPVAAPTTIQEAMFDAWASSANTSTGLAHPNDRDRLIETIKRLRGAGHGVNASSWYRRALDHGFTSSHAGDIKKVVDDLNAGKRLRQKDKGPWWKDDILEQLAKDLP